ncbi:helitron helicase-like domain-containing protein [Artemisia annua]|uniref:Helitron helicase-like domain-containing protein n=1 Tax=Artemisia annua TaxID=35608 RepID=A0A2U1NQH7_ARTAN|nr:helitron helicase-like domain-containing protein [Artemisia annua]
MKYNLKNNAQKNRDQLLGNPKPNNAASVHGSTAYRLDQSSLSTSIVGSSTSASSSGFNCDATYSGPVMLDFDLQTVRHLPYEYSAFNKENCRVTSRQVRAHDDTPSNQMPVPLSNFFSTQRLKRTNVTNNFGEGTRKRRKTVQNSTERSNKPSWENNIPATDVTTHPTQRCLSPSELQISSDNTAYDHTHQPYCHASKGACDTDTYLPPIVPQSDRSQSAHINNKRKAPTNVTTCRVQQCLSTSGSQSTSANRLYNSSEQQDCHAMRARGYGLPTSQAIGAIVFDSGPTTETDYDIVIEYRDGPAKRINKLHQSYMSLQFPLIFIYGQPGYHIKLMTRSADPNERMQRVSMNAFYTYQLHPRHDSYNLLFRTMTADTPAAEKPRTRSTDKSKTT